MRSLTFSENLPAERPVEGVSDAFAFEPMDAVSRVTAGLTGGTGCGGAVTFPAVKEPFICVGWASQT